MVYCVTLCFLKTKSLIRLCVVLPQSILPNKGSKLAYQLPQPFPATNVMNSFELSSKYIESSPWSRQNRDFNSPPPNREQPMRLTPFSRYPQQKYTRFNFFEGEDYKIKNKTQSCYRALILLHVSCLSQNLKPRFGL